MDAQGAPRRVGGGDPVLAEATALPPQDGVGVTMRDCLQPAQIRARPDPEEPVRSA